MDIETDVYPTITSNQFQIDGCLSDRYEIVKKSVEYKLIDRRLYHCKVLSRSLRYLAINGREIGRV